MANSQSALTKILSNLDKSLKHHPYNLVKIMAEIDDYQLSEILNASTTGRVQLFQALTNQRQLAMLRLMTSHSLRNIIDRTSDKIVGELLNLASPSVRNKVVRQIELGRFEGIKEYLEDKIYKEASRILNSPSKTVMRLTLTEVISLTEDQTVSEAKAMLAKHGLSFAPLHQLYILKNNGNYRGIIPIADIFSYLSHQTIDQLIIYNVPILHPSTKQDTAIRYFQSYDTSELPVVDQGKLIGRVLVEDIVDVIGQFYSEQLQKLGGISGEEEMPETPALTASKRRLPWMIGNIGLDLMIIMAIMPFEEIIGQVTALAVLMPIVSDMGGNIGIQSLTVSIRGLNNGQFSWRLPLAEFRKELITGTINGLVLGLIIGVIGLMGWGNLYLGVLVFTALFINTIIASIMGGLIPILLKRLGKDPALMSGAILTTITDLTGFLIFLGLAMIFLERLIS